MSGIVALVPLRDGVSGKTRLAHRFSERERAVLIAGMARHVVRTLVDSGVIETVLVVTRDPEFAERSLHDIDPCVRIIPQPGDAFGLNGALDAGRLWALAHAASGILIAHADLPALDRDDVRDLVQTPSPVVLAPDLHRTGTNALLLRFAAGLPKDRNADERFCFQFGAGSYAAHIAEADRLGLAATTVIMSGTERDLDTIDDWQTLPETLRRSLEQEIRHEMVSCHAKLTSLAAPGARS